jgi:hypothetical protein
VYFSFALYMGSENALIAFDDNRISFPVTNTALIGENGWTFSMLMRLGIRAPHTFFG